MGLFSVRKRAYPGKTEENLFPSSPLNSKLIQEPIPIEKEKPQNSFSIPSQEKLIYDIFYKGIKLGEATLIFHGETRMGSLPVYYVTFYTNTFYFKDLEEIFATKDFLPLKIKRTIEKLPHFTTLIKEDYDQNNFRIKIKKKSLILTRNFTIEKDKKIHNAILLSYYYRTKNNFKKDKEFYVNLPTLNFKIIFKGEKELTTPLGKFLAYEFISKPPKFRLYIAKNKNRLPLKIENPQLWGYSLVLKKVEVFQPVTD